MNRLILSTILILTTLLMSENSFGENDRITIVGSSTILPIIKDAKKPFYQLTGIQVIAKGGGSSVGVSAAFEGSADIGMVSRALTREETSKLQAHQIGYDGIAVILNTAIKIKELSRKQIVDIFTGSVTNWKNLGGKTGEITVIAKDNRRATRKLFDDFFSLEKVVSSALIIGSNTEAIIMVAGTPDAIGYVSIGSAENAVGLGLNLRLLSLDSVLATSENIANENYPLRRPLNLVTLNKAGKNTHHFIRFLQSDQGQKIIQKNNFIVLKRGGSST